MCCTVFSFPSVSLTPPTTIYILSIRPRTKSQLYTGSQTILFASVHVRLSTHVSIKALACTQLYSAPPPQNMGAEKVWEALVQNTEIPTSKPCPLDHD